MSNSAPSNPRWAAGACGNVCAARIDRLRARESLIHSTLLASFFAAAAAAFDSASSADMRIARRWW